MDVRMIIVFLHLAQHGERKDDQHVKKTALRLR
jgi:hypothetical protein